MSTATPAPGAGAGARRDPAAPSLTALAVLRTRIELKQFFRERDAVIFIFAFPVIMLAIFGSVFDEDVGGGVSFTQYFVPGIVAAGIMLSSFQSLAIGIAIERDDGTLKRLRGTPMPPAAYFLGKIGMVLVSSVLQTGVLLTAAALVFNIDLPTSPSRWVTFAWVFVLGTSAGTVLGIAFSSVPRSGRSASAVVTPIVIVLQFISGVFFVYDDLPAWMRNIAELFPLKWMAQGMRSVFLPDSYQSIEADGSWQLGLGAVVLGAWLVVGLAACLWTFRWSRRDAG